MYMSTLLTIHVRHSKLNEESRQLMKHCHRYIHKSYREACLYDMHSKAYYEILVQDEKEVIYCNYVLTKTKMHIKNSQRMISSIKVEDFEKWTRKETRKETKHRQIASMFLINHSTSFLGRS